MKKYTLHFIFALILSFLLGCKEKSDLPTSNNEVPSENIIVPLFPIDSKLNLKVFEEISSSNNNVVLLCSTENIYSPAGSTIISGFTKENNLIKIVFTGLSISNHGATIFSPAYSRYDLSTLHVGSYQLEISINGKKLIGLITVSGESFKLQMQPNNIIHFDNEILYRVPKTTIWGQAESKEQSQYQQFLDSLIVLGAKPHNLNPGDYNYFEVDAQGGFNTHSALSMSYGKYFLYNFEGDTTLTRNLIKRFAKRYLDSLNIQFNGGRGEMYHSTVLMKEP